MKHIFTILFTCILPVLGIAQVVVIDPGHGYGATANDNPDGRSAIEIETSLEVGLRTKALIQNSCNWTVHMTRTTNLNSWISVTQRAQMANNWNADRLLSIHCNAGGGTGTETFYCTVNDANTADDIAFAKKIQAEMVAGGQWANRRCVEDNDFLKYHLGVLRYSSAAGCLNEIGFVDNATDAAKLTSSSWRDQFANAYFNAFKANLNFPCTLPGDFSLTVTPECNTTNSHIKLSWTASANATSYQVYRNGNLYTTVTSGTQFINTSVTPGTSYSYYLKAVNPKGTKDNSNGTLSAKALHCVPPAAFTLAIAPECNSTNNTSRIRLNWTASANATSYQIYRNGTLYTTSTGLQFVNSAVTAGVNYSYYVKAVNASGATNNTNGTLSVVARYCTTPGTFSLTVTPECVGTGSRIQLNWTASANATSYQIYRNGSLYTTISSGTQFINYSVAVGTTYSYYVRAINLLGGTNNSNGILTGKAPNCRGTGTLALKINSGCDGITSQAQLNWTASPETTSYEIYRNEKLIAVVDAKTQFTNASLIPDSIYSYYIRIAGDSYTSSEIIKITAPACATTKVNESNNNPFEVTVYPNPSGGLYFLTAKDVSNKMIALEIVNVAGETVYTAKETILGDNYISPINLTGLANGNYFIRIQIDQQLYSLSIIKQ